MTALAIWKLAKPFLPYLAGCLLLAGLVAWIDHRAYQRGKADTVAKYQPVMDRALQNIKTLKGNQAALLTAVDRQNAAVEAAKADGDKRVADGKAALAQVQRANVGLSEQAEALRKSAARKPAANDPCTISLTLAKIGKL